MEKYQSINIDGFRLQYIEKGFGIPILVIGSSLYYPQLFSETLYKTFQFIFLDHRGFVKPSRPLKPEDYTLDEILDDIELVRETLRLTDFIILGHSGHAFIALEYAKKYPEHVTRVILLNSAPTNSQERRHKSFLYFYETANPERNMKKIWLYCLTTFNRILNGDLHICAFGWELKASMIINLMQHICGKMSTRTCRFLIFCGEKHLEN